MTDWIPLPRTLVWPLFLVGLAVAFRGPVRRPLNTVNARVERGYVRREPDLA